MRCAPPFPPAPLPPYLLPLLRYWEFFEQNEAALKEIPPPLVALNYYKGGDLYLFDQLATAGCDADRGCELRRPDCK